jgi:regulator of RNase E activity RraA
MDEAFLVRCRAIAVCTWSDALDQLSIRGVLSGIAHRAGYGHFAGRAVTVKETVSTLDAFPSGDFAVGRIVDALKPDDVLMVDMGGAEVSTMGGNAAMAIKRSRAVAAVIDGGCRDLDEILQSGLWVASRHLTPVTGKTRVKVTSIGEPVVVGGVTVRTGDLVVGDDTGIVVVPATEGERALALAEEVQRTDIKLEEGLKSGLSFAEAARAAKYL